MTYFLRSNTVWPIDGVNLDKISSEFIQIPSEFVIDSRDSRNLRSERQSSSIDSDEDPPHMRMVTTVQINSLTVSFTLPEETYSINSAYTCVNNGKASSPLLSRKEGFTCKRRPTISVQLIGSLHSNMWTEHATLTEVIQQITLKNFRIIEIFDGRKVCLLWTREALDANAQPFFNRGIKESSFHDIEKTPDTCFITGAEWSGGFRESTLLWNSTVFHWLCWNPEMKTFFVLLQHIIK